MLQVTAPAYPQAPVWVRRAKRPRFVLSGQARPTGPSPQPLGRSKAAAFASSPSPETPDSVAAPTAWFARHSVDAVTGSALLSLSEIIAFRTA